MSNELRIKLQNKSDKEIQQLSNELNYYFGDEKQLIIEEINRRNSLKISEAKKEKSVYTSKIELLIVLIVGFGFFAFSSTYKLIFGQTANDIQVSNYGTYFNTLYQIIVLTIIGTFLKFRGWKLLDFNLRFKFRMIFIAILLLLTTALFINIILVIIDVIGLDIINTENKPNFTIEANWLSLVMIIVINSIYEESLLIGYLFKRFEKMSPIIVIVFSMLIRLSFHTYQGWFSLISIPIISLVFGIYYIKYRKLWPLIIAHGLNNSLLFLSIFLRPS
ncbi:CPBP family intramembrane metalloprotease [Carboxylicivirga mesophila]|uniref:CPBP family intramembrane metalloprotease n=1 Tax=Carboxylicivirga mesophila TaxID=1166478 RepID=A0ABS5KDW6_9BACT|nr:type II CAAX endopeptidase family protein [Carboxylicivirga mesophila]MBS2212716.1 CPBP family intramembrane metalloprotease [Carboxylicivirga mesophila]